MRTIKKIVCISLLLPFYIWANGAINITGKVTSATNGKALSGVNILIKNTETGTVTNKKGIYSITVPDSTNILVFSSVGYQSLEISIARQSVVDVSLKDKIESIEEIVIIGYGGIRKKELTGAVASVKANELSLTIGSDINQALQGRVAGVSIQASSGAPGSQANVHVRGIGSLSASSVHPLYVVDGIPQEGIPNITPGEIESVHISKDGATAAIYGTRASNGVIHIVTKRGKGRGLSIDYSNYFGIQNVTSGIPLMNTEQQIFALDQEAINNGHEEGTGIFLTNPDALRYNSDFQEFIVKNNAPLQNHTLVITGGQNGSSFGIINNYYSQDGVIKNSGYQSLSSRFNGEMKKKRLTIFASLSVKSDKVEAAHPGIYLESILQPPYTPLPVDDESAIIPGNPDYYSGFSKLFSEENITKRNTIGANTNINIEIINGLVYTVRVGGNLSLNRLEYWRPQFLILNSDGDIHEGASRMDASLLYSYSNSQRWIIEQLLNYKKRVRKHSITVLTGYTREEYIITTESAEKTGFLSNDTRVWDAANGLVFASGSMQQYRSIGMLSRLMYNFDERYLFSASLRNDASSRFGAKFRRSPFWGGSVGWNIAEEPFFLGVLPIINLLKLRASLAEVGNDEIPYYTHITSIEAGSDYIWGREGDEIIAPGYTQRTYSNPGVHWETNISKNIGVDLVLLNGKFSGAIDVYHNSKKDMLIPVDLAPSWGTWIPPYDYLTRSTTKNVGDMVNKGVEVALAYKDQKSEFKWHVQGIFSKNKNVVTKLPDNLGPYSLGTADFSFVVLDHSVPTFQLIPTNGVIKDSSDLAQYNSQFSDDTGARIGDLWYLDANGDSISDANDRVPHGTPLPDFELGLNLNAEYKGFDIAISLFYSHGGVIYNGSKAIAYNEGRHLDQFYHWTPVNSESDIPALRFSVNHRNQDRKTDQFIEDGTYMRVRNIIIGYSLPQKLLDIIKVERVRAYMNLQNPITFTKYTGFDPEIGFGPNYFGMGDALFSRGIDAGNYPVSRKYIFGLQFTF